MVVSERPGQYSALGYGAVDFPFLNRNADGFLNELKRRLFQEIYLFQRIDYTTGKPVAENQLDEGKFKTETLYEAQVDANLLYRVSRVVWQ